MIMRHKACSEIYKGASYSRRKFFKNIAVGAAGLSLGSFGAYEKVSAENTNTGKSLVGFETGADRREMISSALKPFEDKIGAAVEGKQVVIKVNMGQIEGPLNATHPDSVRGVLDFLRPIYKKRVIVAESTAGSERSTLDGFKNFFYTPMLKEYKVKFVDLNEQPETMKWIKDANNHPLGINIIDTFLDPDVYMISVTRIKSHNCVVATLSLKNIVMASPINHYRQKIARGRNEKPLMHSGGNHGLSYNLFLVANEGVQPDLAVLDGVVGMEGDGPVWGTPIEHKVVLAGTDWLAVDRIAVELMGIDYSDVMYMRWCGDAGMGNDNLTNIEVTGSDYTKHIRNYRMHKNIAGQLDWVRKFRSTTGT
jgi:uncharacterized protein (DUF362 family)